MNKNQLFLRIINIGFVFLGSLGISYILIHEKELIIAFIFFIFNCIGIFGTAPSWLSKKEFERYY